MKSFIPLLFVFFPFLYFSQQQNTIWETNTGRRPSSGNYLREADIGWAKRIWRTIDFHDKLNQHLFFPEVRDNHSTSLFDVVRKAALSGEIAVYSPNDDVFSNPLTADEIMAQLTQTVAVPKNKNSVNAEEFGQAKYETDTLHAEDIVQYYLKEVWFFDTKRSVLDVRIIGICPVTYQPEKDFFKPLFWINLQECRSVLVQHTAPHPRNIARKLSFDDIFIKRMFNSYITKESNLEDKSIDEYKVGKEKWLEAERIKNKIYNLESDMWQY